MIEGPTILLEKNKKRKKKRKNKSNGASRKKLNIQSSLPDLDLQSAISPPEGFAEKDEVPFPDFDRKKAILPLQHLQSLSPELRNLELYFESNDFMNDERVQQNSVRLIKGSTVPLMLNPSIPAPAEINKIATEKFINSFPSPSMKETARKLISKHITYISFEDLEKGLKQSILALRKSLLIKKIDFQSTSVAIELHHSTHWVASLAIKYLDFVPEHFYSIDRGLSLSGHSSDHQKKCFDFSKIKKGETHNLFIFDDWSISGRQLSELLSVIYSAKEENNKFFELNIFLVVPFMTKAAHQECLQAIPRRKGISLNIFSTGQFFPSMEDIFNQLEPQDRENINMMLWAPPETPPEIYRKQVLAYSDWKTLDYVSMPPQFVTGSHRFIPDITPPYKKEAGMSMVLNENKKSFAPKFS